MDFLTSLERQGMRVFLNGATYYAKAQQVYIQGNPAALNADLPAGVDPEGDYEAYADRLAHALDNSKEGRLHLLCRAFDAIIAAKQALDEAIGLIVNHALEAQGSTVRHVTHPLNPDLPTAFDPDKLPDKAREAFVTLDTARDEFLLQLYEARMRTSPKNMIDKVNSVLEMVRAVFGPELEDEKPEPLSTPQLHPDLAAKHDSRLSRAEYDEWAANCASWIERMEPVALYHGRIKEIMQYHFETGANNINPVNHALMVSFYRAYGQEINQRVVGAGQEIYGTLSQEFLLITGKFSMGQKENELALGDIGIARGKSVDDERMLGLLCSSMVRLFGPNYEVSRSPYSREAVEKLASAVSGVTRDLQQSANARRGQYYNVAEATDALELRPSSSPANRPRAAEDAFDVYERISGRGPQSYLVN
jgi:hypothetical protein